MASLKRTDHNIFNVFFAADIHGIESLNDVEVELYNRVKLDFLFEYCWNQPSEKMFESWAFQLTNDLRFKRKGLVITPDMIKHSCFEIFIKRPFPGTLNLWKSGDQWRGFLDFTAKTILFAKVSDLYFPDELLT